MKTRHISLFLWIILLFFTLPATAQDMTVRSMVHRPNDMTANTSDYMVKDNNGVVCGIVKVMLAADDASFHGLVKEFKLHRPSEYWVWMAKDADYLQINAPGYLPLRVNFRDYDDCIIESRHTYVLTITLPQMGNVPVDDGMRYLVFTVEPKNSTVLVDGKPQTVENGEVVVSVPKGKHSYQVLAPGYATEQGEVEVGDGKKTLSVSLKSLMASLRVECETKGAQIYIDNQLRGTAPWSGSLKPGSYQLEARLDGHRTQHQSVTLGEKENRTVTLPALDMVVGNIDVNVTPVNADVLIDGKKVGTTPDVFRNIQVGQRRVEIKKDGYETMTKTVTVKENEQASVTGTLKANAASTPSSTASTPSSAARETITVNGVSFTMVRVDGGTFTMGATPEQGSDAEYEEKPAHEVILSTYWIGETEVTQELWEAVMGNNPSSFKDKPDSKKRPVECVSWEDCQEFIAKLNAKTGRKFRLPTEAEWEYAARGGKNGRTTKYAGSDNLGEVAWYEKNAYHVGKDGKSDSSSPDYGTHPVGKKAANELGLYDMSGNVWEWCSDWFDDYSSSAQTNPKGPSSASYRVFRGGSWNYYARFCRVSNRYNNSPGSWNFSLGLRLAL